MITNALIFLSGIIFSSLLSYWPSWTFNVSSLTSAITWIHSTAMSLNWIFPVSTAFTLIYWYLGLLLLLGGVRVSLWLISNVPFFAGFRDMGRGSHIR